MSTFTPASAEPSASVADAGAAGPRPGQSRVLLLAAFGPPVAGYAAVAALLAVVTATAAGGTFTPVGVLRAAGPGWLAACHVPVRITGHELGALPLLPTALVLALAGRAAGRVARRLDWHTPRHALRIAGLVGGGHATFAALLAVVCSDRTLSCPPVVAFFVVGAFTFAAAGVGLVRPCGLASTLPGTDPVTGFGLRVGLLALLGMVAVGALTSTLGFALSLPTTAHLFGPPGSGFGAGFGRFALSVAYLPNVLVGALSLAAGPGFAVGSLAVSQWSFHPGPVPAVPVLALVPPAAAGWWPALLLLPAGVGVLVGLVCRRSAYPLAGRFRAVLLAALVAGVGCLILAALAGGPLGGGRFDPVAVPAGLLAVAVFGWIGVVGAAVVWLGRSEEDEPPDELDYELDEEPGEAEADDAEGRAQ